MKDLVGQTKDAGWQFGIRRTLVAEASVVWEHLFEAPIAELWLEHANTDFSTYKFMSHIRTKWQLDSWSNLATLQMRIIPNKNKTVLAFHIDNLLDAQQRLETKTYWSKKITLIKQWIDVEVS
jgi:hypothetical protein